MQASPKADILKQKVVITTHPKKDKDELHEKLTAHGAKVWSMPVIKIAPLSFQLDEPQQYDWIVFTSKNAVKSFIRQVTISPIKIAALGAKTAQSLKEYGLQPTFIGHGKSSEDFADEFLPKIKENEKILLVLGNLAPDTLQKAFNKKATVDRLNVYETRPIKTVDDQVLNFIRSDQYDLIVVTSPSAVHAIFQLLPTDPGNLRFISIGKTTDAAIRYYGMPPRATSKSPNYEALADTIINYFKISNQ